MPIYHIYLARIFHELPSRDRETGNPLVQDAVCGAGLSGAEGALILDLMTPLPSDAELDES